ncbi:MAG TPA: HAD family hydrolase [Candidatus Nanopelagicales bacterium]|nr:HAD family hydrolase [Candidatus Nanopelagicales bacterium]
MIRLLATDLDGTLLRPDGTVSRRTVRSLAAARRAGFGVVFVTGRPPRWLDEVVTATGHAGIAVCANGALLVDLDHDRVLAVDPLPGDLAAVVAGDLRAALPSIHFAVEYAPRGSVRRGSAPFGREHRYPLRGDTDPSAPVADIDQLTAHGEVVKLLVRTGPATVAGPDELLAVARQVLGDRAEATHSSPTDTLLEISAPGVSKASALARHAASLGLSASQVAAVGDMPNDIPMLAWAGRSYAVTGGHPGALAATDGRVATAVEDGVAALLDELLAQHG